MVLAAFAVFVALMVGAFTDGLGWWYRAASVAFCGVSVLGLAELASTRLTIDERSLSFVKTFRRRELRREDVHSVTWAKGVGVSIRLRDGEWVRLPQVGRSHQGVTNTIRAWLARGRPAMESGADAPGEG